MLLVDDLAAGGTKNLRHTPRGLVTLITDELSIEANSVDPEQEQSDLGPHCLPKRFLNISADEKSRRLLLRLEH